MSSNNYTLQDKCS